MNGFEVVCSYSMLLARKFDFLRLGVYFAIVLLVLGCEQTQQQKTPATLGGSRHSTSTTNDVAEPGRTGKEEVAYDLQQSPTIATDSDSSPKYFERAGEHGITPLLEALLNRDKKSFEQLLDAGADPNVWDDRGRNAVTVAASMGGSQYWLRYVLLYGGDPQCRLVESGPLTPTWAIGSTPLHCAMASDNMANVRVLVEAKVDLNVKDANGMTPLGIATGSHLYEIAEFLIDCGADVSEKAIDGDTIRDFILSSDATFIEEQGDVMAFNRLKERFGQENGAELID